MSSFDQVIKNILTDIFGSDEQEDIVRPKARPSGLGAPTTSLRPRRRPDQDDADEEAIPSGANSASRFIAGMADFDDTPEEGVDIPLATLQTDARNLNGKYRTTAMQLAKLNKGAPLTDGGRANVKVAGVVEDTEVDDILAEVKMVMDPLASTRPRARPKSVEEIQAIRKEQRSYTKIDSTRDLQTALNAAGITVNGKSLVEDGIMGKNTRKAIKSFQEREGLKVDGIAGPNTKQALRSVAPDSPIVESLVFDTRPSLAREDQIAGENRFSDALINERLLSSDKSEDVTEPEGLMTRPSVAREGQISGEGALDQFASSATPRAGIFTGAFRGFASLFKSLSTAEGQAKALIKAAPLASKILPINAAKFAEFLGNEGKVDLTSDDLGKQNYNYLRKKALDVIKRGDDKFSYSDWGFEEKSVLVKDMTKTAWGSIKDPAFRMATLIGQTAPGNVRIENGRVLVEDVYDFNTGPLGKKMQKAFELREAGDEEGYEKLSSEALKGQTHLGQLRVWAAALGVPQGEGTRFTLDLGEAP